MNPPASQNWSFIGKNPYGETVEGLPSGFRRVATEKGWVKETEVSSWRACRFTNQEDANKLMRSLSTPVISKSFDHNIKKAYCYFRLGKNEPLSSIPSHWGTESDPVWKVFKSGVEQIRGDRVHVAWMNHRPEAPNIPRWETALSYPTSPVGLVSRGVQWGLAHFIEEMQQRFCHLNFIEVGIPSSVDAAISRLPNKVKSIQTWIRSNRVWAPPAEIVNKWPKSANRSKAFGAKTATLGALSNHTCFVIWAFPQSEAKLGSLSKEWLQVSNLSNGVVVFPVNLPNHAAELVSLLKKNGAVLSRFKIKGHAEVWHWGFSPKSLDISQSLEEWSAVADEVSSPLVPPASENGKVPYRALSKVSEPEGMANVALEFNMHQALIDFTRRHPGLDVDEFVSSGLGLSSVEQLKERLSPEQVDAIALARDSLGENTGMLVSDETGFGKGRTMASMILSGLKEGRTVVFFTLNHFLFSDLYRDLMAIMPDGETPPTPLLFHRTAVLKDVYGNVVSKSLNKKNFDEMLQTHTWDNGVPKLIFTTYSQFSKTKDGGKIRWLKNRMENDAWLLLDEAHGAAGDSNVGKSMEELIKASAGVLYASATFAYKASNLPLYRPALNIPDSAFRVLVHAMTQDDGVLREALTHQIAREGRLVRREHPPVPPPEPLWVSMTPESEEFVKTFSLVWQNLYDSVIEYSALVNLEEGAWNYLGGVLGRSAKEFSLQMKVNSLIEVVLDIVQNKKEKVVVVVDSTFESALRQALTPEAELPEEVPDDASWEDDEINMEEEVDEPKKGKGKDKKKPAPPPMIRSGVGAPPLWRDRILALLEAVCPEDVWRNMSGHAKLEQLIAKTREHIQNLPDWDLSPLDRVRNALREKGVYSGELSGRKTRLIIRKDEWEVINHNEPDRNTQVASFNAGEFDVMFVTRAGAAGISLHAGVKFKDQRRRTLVEWDIASNPVVRVQFWGRVRRKDQVCEPGFLGLCFDTPEDRRIIEREKKKFHLLSAHAGHSISSDVSLLSELGEDLISEWAQENPEKAFKLGIKRPVPDNPIGRIDRALIRSLVLPFDHRQDMLGHVERGLKVGSEFFQESQRSQSASPSRLVQRQWWWGDKDATLSDPAKSLEFLRLDLVERVWMPTPGAGPEKIYQALKESKDELSGLEVVQSWKKAWSGKSLNPFHAKEAQWAVENLTGLKVGSAVSFTHPFSRRPVRAILLGWELPKVLDPRNWSLSQVGMRIWPVGDDQDIIISFAVLARDKAFKDMKKTASVSWYQEPPLPLRSLSMEGHPVQSAAWGRRWNVGKSSLINDEDHGHQVVWLLPPTFTWEQAQSLPRDLVDFRQALIFLKQFENGTLLGALPYPHEVKATATKQGLHVEFNESAWKMVTRSWMDGWNAKRLRFKGTLKGGASTTLPWKGISAILAGWSNNGLDWRVSVEHLDWYEKTSKIYLKV